MAEYDDSEEVEHNSTKRYAMKKKGGNVDIHDPMTLWIFLLLVAVVIRLLIANTSYIPTDSEAYSAVVTYSNFLLQFPGIMILPLIVGGIVGTEVGERSSTLQSTLRSGLLNGIYASIIYLIAIVIIYIVLNYYTAPQFSTLYTAIINGIILPIVTFMLVLEIFAVLSYSRSVDQ